MILPDLISRQVLEAAYLVIQSGIDGAQIALFTNNIVPTASSPLSAFTELTTGQVPGYERGSWINTAGDELRRQDGQWEGDWSSESSIAYLAGGTVPSPVTVYGWFALDSSTGLILLGSGTFNAPFTFSELGDGFQMASPIIFGQGGVYSIFTLPDFEPE